MCTQENNRVKKSESGFSLVELLMVITILAVVTTFAVLQTRRSKTRFQREKIGAELRSSLERARFDSVKRRATNSDDMSRVEITSTTSYTVRTDSNGNGTILLPNGTLDSSELRSINFADSNSGVFVGNNLSLPITVSFDHLGHVRLNGVRTSTSVTFKVCDEGCANENAGNTTIISLSPSGTVAVSGGGTSFATPVNPTVTNISANTNIRGLGTVNANY